MIDKYHTPGTFVNGNTIDYSDSMPRNYAVLSAYALADAACQYKYPTGYAVAPVPYTEAIRIPAPEEIVEGQLSMDLVIEKAPYYARYMDWEKINDDAELLVTGANMFFERVMNALDDLGVDTEHAGEIAAVLKAIGPEQLETNFGSGLRDKEAMRGRVPIRPTSIVQTINHIRDEALSKIDVSDKGPLDGIKVVVGSTDVHEFGKEVVRNVISKAGATVFDLGTTVSIPEVADTLVETGSNILCMSTYNGMAYGYARDLVESLDKAGLGDTHIIMGGRLNEPLDGSDVPIDCSDRLAKMGINVDNDVDTMVDTIKKMAEGDK